MKGHWLQGTLIRAGVASADALDLTAGTPVRRAWAIAGSQLGMTESQLAEHVASRFHLRLADFESVTPAVSKLVPESVVRRHHLLPLREDDREIVVAVADPTDLDAEQAVAFASGRQVVFEVAPPTSLAAEIERRYAPGIAVEQLMERVDAQRADSVRIVDDIAGTVDRARGGESGAVVKLTNLMLRAAIDQRASLIEIAPTASAAAITFVVDGVRTRFMPLPVPAMNHVLARLRLLANMGIANRPQSAGGGARIRVEGRTWDLDLAVEQGPPPRAHIRIYDQQTVPRLNELGLTSEAVDALRTLLAGDGLVVLTAPPDHGGDVLLHAVLRELAQANRRIGFAGSLRWPINGVEPIDGVPAASLASTGLDVFAFDDAGDDSRARALSAAVTPGSLVIVALTAPSAAAAVTQLRSLAEPQHMPAPRAVVSTRLLRRICGACHAAAVEPTCTACAGTGYRGALIALHTARAGEGMDASEESAGLLDDAGHHVRRGDTTPAEVQRALRATGNEKESAITVLVADDDPVIRTLARTVLEADGHAVVEADDGVAALERVDGSIGLLVLDLDMPRLDGHEVVARLKRDLSTAGLPIVVLTASANPADESRALERGADDYIRKPIDPPRFVARIRAVLRRANG